MTGEEGKGGGGGGGTESSDNVINNANHQNGGPEKAPVVGGTNVETLPRPGKQLLILQPCFEDGSPDQSTSAIVLDAYPNMINIINFNQPPQLDEYSLDLITFLRNNSEGKKILKAYEINGNSLTPLSRKSLVHLIVQREKNEAMKNLDVGEVLEAFDLPKKRFQVIAKEIEEIFEGESADTYYKPFCVCDGQKISASGKLYDHFSYVKSVLRTSGLLSRSKKKSSGQIKQATLSESQKEDFKFLQNNSEPFDKIKDIFIRTRSIRRDVSFLQGQTIFEYMCSIRSIRDNEQGQILIHLEFDALHEKESKNLFEKWPKIRNYLVKVVREVKAAVEENPDIVSLMNTESPENQDIFIYYLIDYITIRKNRKRKQKEDTPAVKKNYYKERRASYLVHVKDADELDTTLKNLKEKNKKKQPFIVIVGPLQQIEAFYVIVDDIQYSTESILHAIDLNFKIFHVFDCKYPEGFQFFWEFFQGVIYELTNSREVLSLKNRIMSGEIKNILSQETSL